MKIFILYFLLEGITIDHPFYFESKEECQKHGVVLSIPYEGYRCVQDFLSYQDDEKHNFDKL